MVNIEISVNARDGKPACERERKIFAFGWVRMRLSSIIDKHSVDDEMRVLGLAVVQDTGQGTRETGPAERAN